jgi:arylsulfatase A-like enzyme
MTIADVAQEADLRTSCIGKWHLGWRWPKQGGGTTQKPQEIDYTLPIGGGPLEAGFESYFGDDVPNWPPYVWIENDAALTIPSGTMAEDGANGVRAGPMTPGWSLEAVLPRLTRRCVETIRDHARAQERFFLYFSMTSPHTPISPSEAFQGQSGVSAYGDFLLETDWSVGQVLRALDQYGVADDTMVIFVTDNGTSPKADFSSLSKGGVDLRGIWRGHKADIWEGGHRVPFLVRWPGVVRPASHCDQPVGLTDVMATVAEVLGVDLPAGSAEDSRSLLGILRGRSDESSVAAHLPDGLVQQSSSGRFAVRAGSWKLCFCPGSAGWSQPRGQAQAKKLGLPSVQLYDLSTDPSEEHNLARQEPERVVAMTQLLRQIVESHPNDGKAWWRQLPWPE